jgi:peptidoglycan/xylan/chitin deacetylase (PgdA/CDA1 family)
LTHARLPELDAEACRHELAASRRALEDALGHEVTDLAYPFGAFDATVRAAAQDAGYTTAVTTIPAHATGADDPLALPRHTIRGDDSFLGFVSVVRTARRLSELRPPLALYRAASCALAALIP